MQVNNQSIDCHHTNISDTCIILCQNGADRLCALYRTAVYPAAQTVRADILFAASPQSEAQLFSGTAPGSRASFRKTSISSFA
jgi:hypothetical protein